MLYDTFMTKWPNSLLVRLADSGLDKIFSLTPNLLHPSGRQIYNIQSA
ncbi:hypothetical protein SHEWT2_03558 [Shewanella hafniensis]|nr:hypothetical protein SHEWT2_03558 [Shewanella hafniensis]